MLSFEGKMKEMADEVQSAHASCSRYLSQGTNRRAYEMLGAHPCLEGDTKKWHFCLWAPNALQVSLTGSFNGWDSRKHPMAKQHDGTWELRLDESEILKDAPGDGVPVYKYAVTGADGKLRLKADPYGFFAELRPDTGSRVYDLDGYRWKDQSWMKERSSSIRITVPSISTRFISAPGAARGRQPVFVSGICRRADSLYTGDGLYPYRAFARDGAPAGYVLGVSGARFLRRHLALRHTQAADGAHRPLPPSRNRRDTRLGARAFPARRGGTVYVRWYAFVQPPRQAPRRDRPMGYDAV